MRNFIKLILLILFVIVIVMTAFACTPKKTIEEVLEVTINNVELDLSLGLEDYALTIEWFDQTGAVTQFNKNKPTVVIFNGFSEYDRRETMTLLADIYSTDIVKSSIKGKLNLNLSYYWNKLMNGCNIGVFHYENFADEEKLSRINSKIYDNSLSTYKDKNGEIKSANFSLTEAFYYVWKKTIVDNNLLSNDTYPTHLQEIRFIGNSVGANLAISCSDYLYAAYEQNIIPATYVPNRVTLVNPWFSNDKDEETKVTFRKNAGLESALAYNAKRIKELANKGVVFELIENDLDYFNSYDNIYDGYMAIEHNGSIIYSKGAGLDTDLYEEIKKQVAYLTLKETFSTKYTPEYAKYDRATLDWYLYTAGGSDVDISDRGEGLVPVYDSRGHASVLTGGNFSLKYGISAWTSTVYTRAMRGVEYKMQTINGNNYTDYTMTSFQAEANQVSNLNMENGFFVCGYIYNSKDSSIFVNLRPDAQIAGYNFAIVATPEGGGDAQVFNITTESDGFYKCLLNERLYGCTININLGVPSEKYRFLPKDELATGNAWQVCNKNSIGRDGVSRTMSGTAESNFYVEIRNAGFVKED